MYFLGIDQGTSGSRALILSEAGTVCGYAYRPLERLYPRPGWVEQDPLVVASSVRDVISEALAHAGIDPHEVKACGITCQRNTLFAWHAVSGQPLGNSIVWQDLRTEPLLNELASWPHFDQLRYRLGYPPGTYMGALHLAWRLAHDEQLRQAALANQLRVGLSAAWLVQALGQPSSHLMDLSLVQATGLYDFRAQEYWDAWLDRLAVPAGILPQATSTTAEFGTLTITAPNGRSAEVPVRAMIGDQQSALFGHRCWRPGQAECTHGTASYVEVNIGPDPPSETPVNLYYAWQLSDDTTYCLEAATTVTGAALRWLREAIHLFADYSDIDPLADSVPDAGGVYFVPAFTGLELPHLTPNARGTLFGLTLGTQRAHLVRAFLEAIGYQLRDILALIYRDTGIRVSALRVGGGVSASNAACQIQADLLGIPLQRPTFRETTAWAAATLAGLGSDHWSSLDDLPPLPGSLETFTPNLSADERDLRFEGWQKAIELTRAW